MSTEQTAEHLWKDMTIKLLLLFIKNKQSDNSIDSNTAGSNYANMSGKMPQSGVGSMQGTLALSTHEHGYFGLTLCVFLCTNYTFVSL